MRWSQLTRFPSRLPLGEGKNGLPVYSQDYAQYSGIEQPSPPANPKSNVLIDGSYASCSGSDDGDVVDDSLLLPVGTNNRFKSWWLEILGIICSLGCTSAIVCTLYAIDGKPLRGWQFPGIADRLTPNTLVSILSTLAKVTLLFSVTEGIGQLKWRYLQQRPRRLYDLQIFDDATRGPTGAVNLLCRMHVRARIAVFGALLVILSLAIDVLVQQVLTYPTVQQIATNATASLSYTKAYSANLYNVNDMTPTIDNQQMEGALNRGLYGYDSSKSLDIFCGSGNCTWPSFKSLGVCSTCDDISTKVTTNCTDYIPPPKGTTLNITKGGGWVINPPRAYPNATIKHCTYVSPYKTRQTMAWQYIDNTVTHYKSDFLVSDSAFANNVVVYDPLPTDVVSDTAYRGVGPEGQILRYTQMQISQNPSDWQVGLYGVYGIKPSCLTCTWNFCAQSYSQIRYDNGTTTIGKVESQPLQFKCKSGGNTSAKGCVGIPQGKQWSFDALNLSISAEPHNQQILDLAHSDDEIYAIAGINLQVIGDTFSSKFEGDMQTVSMFAHRPTADEASFVSAHNGSIPWTMDVMAAAMSKMMREGRPESRVLQGTAWMSVTLVEVNWGLLIFPAALPVLGAIFLMFTISVSKSTSPWKSSSLALLYHGIEKDDQDAAEDTSLMEKASKRTYVRLKTQDEHSRLVVVKKQPLVIRVAETRDTIELGKDRGSHGLT